MKTINTNNIITDGVPSKAAFRDFPTKLFVETTTRCNLNCFMCVKQNRGSEICEGDFRLNYSLALKQHFLNWKRSFSTT